MSKSHSSKCRGGNKENTEARAGWFRLPIMDECRVPYGHFGSGLFVTVKASLWCLTSLWLPLLRLSPSLPPQYTYDLALHHTRVIPTTLGTPYLSVQVLWDGSPHPTALCRREMIKWVSMLWLILVKEHRPWNPRWKMGGGREQKVQSGSSSNELWAVTSFPSAGIVTTPRNRPRLQTLAVTPFPPLHSSAHIRWTATS